MTRPNPVAVTATVLFGVAACAASAGESNVEVLKLATAGGPEHTIRLDSSELGFDLHALMDGESRTVTTADGQVVTLTRSGDTLALAVDGESFELPMPGDPQADARHVVKVVRMDDAREDDALLIVTGATLDEATRAQIRSALQVSGVNQAVRFIDGAHDIDIRIGQAAGDTGTHKRIVRKTRIID